MSDLEYSPTYIVDFDYKGANRNEYFDYSAVDKQFTVAQFGGADFVLVPPNAYLTNDHILEVVLTIEGSQTNISDATGKTVEEGDRWDEIAQHMSAELDYSFVYHVGYVDEVEGDLWYPYNEFFAISEHLEWAMVGVDYIVAIDIFEQENTISGHEMHSYHYHPDVRDAILNYKNFVFDYDNEAWTYRCNFTFFNTPVGFKTVQSTVPAMSFLDVFSKAGGMFATINGLGAIIIAILIGGFPLCNLKVSLPKRG